MSIKRFHLFPDDNSDLNNLSPKEAYLRAHTREVLKSLWQESANQPDESIFSWRHLAKLWKQRDFIGDFYHTIFVKNDPFFLKAARLEVQAALHRLLKQLQEESTQSTPLIDMAIHNILAIYAMFCPNRYETITIPIFQNNQWEAVKYHIEPLELTPTTGRWLNIFSDTDRLYSYGLSPVDDNVAPPLLLHSGTGWPTAQGSLAQYLADIWPFKTPGEIFFEWGLRPINNWLEKQQNHSVITLGQSLGGSMAYLTALHRPEKISQADCLNPPGMATDYTENHPLFGAFEATNEKPFIRIQRQQNDLVSKCGIFKGSFYCVKVSTSSAQEKSLLERLGGAHARNYACFDGIKFSDDNLIQQELTSRKREKNTFYLFKLLRVFFFYTILFPYTLVIRPFKKFIERHAFELLIFTLCIILLTSVPPFSSLLGLAFIPWLGSSLATAIIPSLALSQIISKGIALVYDLLYQKRRDFKEFLSKFKDKPPTGKLYDIANLLSLGLSGILYRTIKRIILNPIRHLVEIRTHDASLYSKATQEKTADFDNYQGASISSKLQVASLIVLFYVVVTPLKFLFYDIPRAITSCVRPTSVEDEDDSADATEEAHVTSTPSRSPKKSRGFCSFFQCCRQGEAELHDKPSHSPNL